MTNGRRILAAILVAAGAIAYGVSPIDVIPELLGPIGLIDDAAVWVGAAMAIVKLLKGRDKGPDGPPLA